MPDPAQGAETAPGSVRGSAPGSEQGSAPTAEHYDPAAPASAGNASGSSPRPVLAAKELAEAVPAEGVLAVKAPAGAVPADSSPGSAAVATPAA